LGFRACNFQHFSLASGRVVFSSCGADPSRAKTRLSAPRGTPGRAGGSKPPERGSRGAGRQCSNTARSALLRTKAASRSTSRIFCLFCSNSAVCPRWRVGGSTSRKKSALCTWRGGVVFFRISAWCSHDRPSGRAKGPWGSPWRSNTKKLEGRLGAVSVVVLAFMKELCIVSCFRRGSRSLSRQQGGHQSPIRSPPAACGPWAWGGRCVVEVPVIGQCSNGTPLKPQSFWRATGGLRQSSGRIHTKGVGMGVRGYDLRANELLWL
jgi:hypothetical protein